MRALVQRVSEGSVSVDGETIGEISKGLVILLGIKPDDSEKDIDHLANKCVNLRVFPDDAGDMNRSLLDVNGGALIISQFTLYGNTEKGRRPSFIGAARPEIAESLYEKFVSKVREAGVEVETGRFGAMMRVNIQNDGPVTLMIESK